MSELTVKRNYCDEHHENDHWLDENFKCHGWDLADIQRKGYSYAKHIGGGWFKLIEKYTPARAAALQQDLVWEMAAEAHDSLHAPYYEPDFDF